MVNGAVNLRRDQQSYLDFDLLIDRVGDHFRVHLINSPAGEAEATFVLALSPQDRTLLRTLGGTRRGLRLVSEDAGPLPTLEALGRRLYATVFQENVRNRLIESQSKAAQSRAGLRIRLRFGEQAADLATLPWELLYDAEQERFLGLSESSPVVRYLPLGLPQRAELVAPPLRVLVVLASPPGHAPLNLEQEWAAIQAALAELQSQQKIVLERLAEPTLDGLQKRLMGEEVHVFHFVGHGLYDEATQHGLLLFHSPDGGEQRVPARELGALLHNHRSLRLAYLNACEGAVASHSTVFAGVAQTLVQQGVPMAIAMQDEITDAGAIDLAGTFYTALAHGQPVDSALTQARLRLTRDGGREWVLPVLFSRSPDNRLFDMADLLPTPACPYPGMVPFHEAQAEFFFGRDSEIADAVNRLRLHPFLTVIGPSGSGKSSVVFAGIVPALRRAASGDSDPWNVLIMRPGATPFSTLAQTLNIPPVQLTSGLAPGSFPPRTLLIVDQFEEIFTLGEAAQVADFYPALQSLMAAPTPTLMFTVRADFYPELMACSLWAPIQANRLELTPLGEAELRAAIVGPAALVGVEVEDALAERLVTDAAGQPGVLPLVQETLVLLWEQVKRRRLSLAAYMQLGDGARTGIQVAIARRADVAYNNLPKAAQPMARRVFLRLIQFGEGRADTRRQLSVSNLMAAGDDDALFRQMLRVLDENRLLILAGEESDPQRKVDISHEALIEGWPQLQTWRQAQRQAERERRRFEEQAREWLERGSGEAGLLDEFELHDVEAWLASEHATELGYSEDLVRFVEASRAAIAARLAAAEAARQRELEQQRLLAAEQRRRAEEQEQAAMRLRRRAYMLAGAGMVAVMLAIAAVYFGIDARNQTRIAVDAQATAEAEAVRADTQAGLAATRAAEAVAAQATAEAEAENARIAQERAEREAAIARSRQLAVQSELRLSAGDYDQARLLAIEAGHSHDTVEAFNALRRVLDQPAHVQTVLAGHLPNANQPQSSGIIHAQWNEDESHVLTIGTDRTARVWDAASGAELLRLEGHRQPLLAAQWSQDERRILTTSQDNSAIVWDAQNDAPPVKLEGHWGWITHTLWNDDESRIITASRDGTARVWNAYTGELILELTGHEHEVTDAGWNLDETRILTLSRDGTARLWDASNGQPIAVLTTDSDGPVRTATWSAEGGHILTLSTMSAGGVVSVWEAGAGNRVSTLAADEAPYSIAIWSPDGARFAAAREDGLLIVSDVDGANVLPLAGHSGRIRALHWSTDGERILSGSEDQTVRVWDIATTSEVFRNAAHRNWVLQANWSADERYIMSLDRDGLVLITDITQEDSTRRFQSDGGLRSHALWNADGSRLAIIDSSDRTLQVFDTETTELLLTLSNEMHSTSLTQISANGQQVLSVGYDNYVRIWNLGKEAELPQLADESLWFDHAAWNADNSLLAVWSFSEPLAIWDPILGGQPIQFALEDIEILDVHWHPDDPNTLLTLDQGGYLRLWNAETQTLTTAINIERFSPRRVEWREREIVLIYEDVVLAVEPESGQIRTLFLGFLPSPTRAIVEARSWNTDGSQVLVYHSGEGTFVWDAHRDEVKFTLADHTGNPTIGRWNRDETLILVGNSDGSAGIWNAETGRRLVSSAVHTAGVRVALWNATETRVLSGDEEGLIFIWDATSGERVTAFFGHATAIRSAEWNADESLVLSLDEDGGVRVWDAITGEEKARFELGPYRGVQATWNHAGTRFLLVKDGWLYQYYASMTDLLRVVCARIPRHLSEAEWRIYRGDAAFQNSCSDYAAGVNALSL